MTDDGLKRQLEERFEALFARFGNRFKDRIFEALALQYAASHPEEFDAALSEIFSRAVEVSDASADGTYTLTISLTDRGLAI